MWYVNVPTYMRASKYKPHASLSPTIWNLAPQ